MNEGATFNADPSSSTKGWDDPKVRISTMVVVQLSWKAAILGFTAKGANTTDGSNPLLVLQSIQMLPFHKIRR